MQSGPLVRSSPKSDAGAPNVTAAIAAHATSATPMESRKAALSIPLARFPPSFASSCSAISLEAATVNPAVANDVKRVYTDMIS